jgi:hypothetical protein
MESNFMYRKSYPIKNPSNRVMKKYTSPKTSFKENKLEKCFVSRWLFCAIFLLLNWVTPKSRIIFNKKEKLKRIAYSP